MMKKIVCLASIVIILSLLLAFCACGNVQLMDTTYSYEYAYITLPNGKSVEGKVSSWKDYEDSDVVQVVINGKTYLTHYSNVVLVSD